jgi:hypothetical protein
MGQLPGSRVETRRLVSYGSTAGFNLYSPDLDPRAVAERRGTERRGDEDVPRGVRLLRRLARLPRSVAPNMARRSGTSCNWKQSQETTRISLHRCSRVETRRLQAMRRVSWMQLVQPHLVSATARALNASRWRSAAFATLG